MPRRSRRSTKDVDYSKTNFSPAKAFWEVGAETDQSAEKGSKKKRKRSLLQAMKNKENEEEDVFNESSLTTVSKSDSRKKKYERSVAVTPIETESRLGSIVNDFEEKRSQAAETTLHRRYEMLQKKYEMLKNARETKQEEALRIASVKIEKLEAIHQQMRSRLEEELKSTQASLTKAVRDLKRSKADGNGSEVGSRRADAHTKNSVSVGSEKTQSERTIVSYFKSLTGLQIEKDADAPQKVHCTAICRPKKRGVKFIVSLPESERGGKCQFIPRANGHLLPGHLREPLEIDAEDAPSVIADVIGALWAD